ncbi:hypothetical protein ABTC48_20160, partial [Acinetobacter baumannii]
MATIVLFMIPSWGTGWLARRHGKCGCHYFTNDRRQKDPGLAGHLEAEMPVFRPADQGSVMRRHGGRPRKQEDAAE